MEIKILEYDDDCNTTFVLKNLVINTKDFLGNEKNILQKNYNNLLVLYTEKEKDYSHGEFVILEESGAICYPEGDETLYAIFMHGAIYFDGIRHLWVGWDDTTNSGDGYLFCPTLSNLSTSAEIIRDLQTYYECELYEYRQ